MSIESDLRVAARAVTDDDTIVDVAIFHPRGFAATTGAGAGIGTAVGGDSTAGSAMRAGAGAYIGMNASGAGRDLPLSICVAISPEKVYLMEHRGATDFAGDLEPPFATLDRAWLGVEVHQRAMNRVVVLHDDFSDEVYPLEAPRFGPYHARAAVRLLKLGDEHHADEKVDG